LKVIWAILCQSSAVDLDSNLVSLFNVVEELTLPAPPPQTPQGQQLPAGLTLAPLFQIVVLWTRSDPEVPEHSKGRLRILLPGGGEATAPEFEVDLTQNPRARHRINLASLPVSRAEGIHRFVIDGMTGTLGWTEMFEVPLSVVFQRQDSG
jgi:hypothetical protein